MNSTNETTSNSDAAVSKVSRDENMWAMLCHLSAFAIFIFPIGNIIAPLVIWLIKKDESAFIDDQGKEAVNFQISITIYFFISAILIIGLIGIPLLIGLGIFFIIITIIAAIKANDGMNYRYPATIRFIT